MGTLLCFKRARLAAGPELSLKYKNPGHIAVPGYPSGSETMTISAVAYLSYSLPVPLPFLAFAGLTLQLDHAAPVEFSVPAVHVVPLVVLRGGEHAHNRLLRDESPLNNHCPNT